MSRQMMIGMHFGNGYGSQAGAWRMPGVDARSYTSFDAQVRHARAAERGKFQFLFVPDFPALFGDLETDAPMITIDPLLTLAAVARETERIGMVATGSTTFNEPYNLARQFKALDIMSHGRVGWNAVPTGDDASAASYGRHVPPRGERYERLHEFVQVVQALWGSWEEGAWIADAASGRFADASKVRPINLRGRHVGSSGPLPLPPSEQGQPVIFQAGGGDKGLEVAGRYASGVIGATYTIADARAQRTALRDAAVRSGRDPDEIKFFPGIITTIADNRRQALDRRIALNGRTYQNQIGYLGQMLGLHLDPGQLDRPLSPEQLAVARPSMRDPRSAHALEIARQGWTLRDVLAHGAIDYHPVIAGPAVEAADHMQEWFEAGAADGFWLSPDVYDDGIDAFVDGVVPILQERGLFHLDYEGSTLRDHLGVPRQYGLDPRLNAMK
ncbi:NtaA/DmoA family FMN-dependent monooxygenase [Sphingomonas aliaeris]|uniref:NtaA/DmoA family FMN-dependent monooxygenase n=1 Tax=Sphingomonas aliaeris TaxID=2759526 RepID=A0A974NXE3_9SPHN|nr:NtaA/DmoA family FMN-dependent monooxygenase [Sphingomonas aliaeris]QQV78578.1 NtaA/DmoA family FMN-dependent monooxygenase [Sphingomonas aliaeris]